jgi:hypothetical protein
MDDKYPDRVALNMFYVGIVSTLGFSLLAYIVIF